MTSSVSRRSPIEQSRLETHFRNHVLHVAFNQVIGLVAECVRLPTPSISFNMKPALIGTPEMSRLHGGVIATALDDIGGVALMIGLSERYAEETVDQLRQRYAKMGTIDLHVDFLRPGLGSHFIATAEVTRLGRRIGVTQMRLVDDEEKLIATGSATYILN